MSASPVQFQFNRSKFKETVLYICGQCEATNLGSVKLHKTLYFADMLKYVWDGQPITGETYQKSQLGPTSQHLYWVLRQLEGEGALQVKEVDHFGYLKKEYIPKRTADTTPFSKEDLQVLDEMIDLVCRKNTARAISEISHTRAWEIAYLGQEIPYHTAFLIFPPMVSAEAMEWAEQEGPRIVNERSKGNAVERRTLRDFRTRVLSSAASHT